MTTYFLDSSALAKLYVAEPGSDWLREIFEPRQGHRFFITRAAVVEVAAALFRRVQNGSIQRDDATLAVTSLRRDLSDVLHATDVSSVLVEAAIGVAERHGLRGYDCIQLAGVLIVRAFFANVGLDAPVLISADVELNTAARGEGFLVEDPNDHAR